ncbi:MAG: PP2C family protein-serine/threonine phosphatase [Bryobacteraceae bacterium]|nr:PP2C family protein-serine/threonine phosphatase [Bryobacteraceae bacterium]
MTPVRLQPGRAAYLALAVAGLTAAAWLWLAVPERDAALDNPSLTRTALVAQARSIARGFDLSTDGWQAVVRLSRDRRPETRLVEANDNTSRSPLLRPSVAVEVYLISPNATEDGRLRAHLHLAEDGRLLDWNVEGGSEEEDLSGGRSRQAPPPAQAALLAALVTHAEERLAGVSTRLFHPMNADPVKADGAYELEAADPSNGALNWRIHLGLKHGHIVKAELDPDVMDGSFFRTFRWRFTTTDLRGIGFAMFLIVSIGATLSGFLAWRRGSFDRRLALVTFGLLALASAGSWLWGVKRDELSIALANGDEGVWLVLGELVALGWAAWMVAAAEARAQRRATSTWAPLRMVLGGRLADGNVARAVAAGLGAGALLAVCRIAPEWAGAPEPYWRVLGLGGLSAGPLSDAFASFGDAEILAVPLFALTWALRFRGAALRTLALMVPAVLMAMAQARTEVSPQLLAWAALAGGAISVLTYWQAGALAVALALPASRLWLAASGDSNPNAMAALAGVAVIALLAGLPEPEPVSDAWLPVDEADLPSTVRERLKAEFTDAREAQRRLLPAVPPALAGYDITALCEPALDVGGDLYDFHTLPDGRTLFSVADVSGKGMPAALYMTLCKGVLAAVCEETSDVQRIAALANRHIYSAGARGKRDRRVFVTAALAALRPESGEIELARAGHNPPLLVRSGGEIAFLKPSGIAFGMAGPVVFDPHLGRETVVLEPGDLLLLYSDGITEAMDREQAQFGEERLVEALREPADSAAICARIVDAVNAFAAGAPQHDDMTLVVIRRTN